MAEDQTTSVRIRRDDLQFGAARRMETTRPNAQNGQPTNLDRTSVPTTDYVEPLDAAPKPEVRNKSKRMRFKWSEDMNIPLYRNYLHITRMETEKNLLTQVAYRNDKEVLWTPRKEATKCIRSKAATFYQKSSTPRHNPKTYGVKLVKS